MNRWFSIAGSILVLLWSAILCLAVEPVSTAAPTRILTKEAAQKLRTPVPRAVVVNSLMSGAATKSALTAEATKRGISSAQIATMVQTPISRALAAQIPVQPMMTAEQAADAALRNLNWDAGLGFTPFNVPRYGSGNWRVGVVEASPSRVATFYNNEFLRMDLKDYRYSSLILLFVELPLNQPAIYAITIRVTNLDGYSQQNWLDLNAARNSAVEVFYTPSQNGTWPTTNLPKIPLTMLQDSTGFVGVISVNPTESQEGVNFAMRRQTHKFILRILNNSSFLDSIFFGGITITRL